MKFNQYDEPRNLRFYDIGAEDHTIATRLEKNRQITMIVYDENDNEVFNETSHPAAWDSVVNFAKLILKQDQRIKECYKVMEN